MLRAERQGGLSFASGSTYSLPFDDATFDLVLCTDLLEHLDEPQRAMAELQRSAESRRAPDSPGQPRTALDNRRGRLRQGGF